ncbi:MAG: FG-GAP-like repeat-containing protein, partial [Bacteroidota bacterium]
AVAITEVSSLWADVNNDGNLDLVYSGLDTLGLPISGVYLNSGSPDFQLSRLNSGGIPGLKSAALAAGDVDNDGDIDILISGETFGGSFVTNVYKNNGSGSFSSTFDMEGTSRGAIALGDVDSDGDLDAVISGESASGIYAEVYVNNGNGRMNESQTLTGLVDGDIDLGDFDADGDLDIAICGASTLAGEDPKLLIYRQDDAGNFTEFSSLQGFVFADLEWADLNIDGFLELLVAGATNSARTDALALVYTYNNAGGAFDATTLGLKLVDTRVAIGDYTNDGLSDVLITGDNIDDPTDPKPTLLLLKNGSATNVNAALEVNLELTTAEFPWTSELAGIQREVKWMDINNDQNLDFVSLATVITAEKDTFESFVLLENIQGLESLDLEVPTSVTLTQDESTLIIKWEDNANSGEISYQIGLGDETGNYNIISPNYVASAGTRTLAQRGQFTGPKSVEIKGLGRGDYFAIVQAVGPNFELSTSKETSGSLSDPQFKDATTEAFAGGTIPTDLVDGDVAFADVNNDGAHDLVIAGTSSISLYLNDGDGSFSLQPGLPAIANAQLEFGDLNLDGALDIMIFGVESAEYKWLAYQGNGAGEFSLLQSATVDNVTEATGKLSDLNGDGSLDFILSGSAGGAPFTSLFQNTGGSFSAVLGGGIAPMSEAALALADFNKDGWIDIFLTGIGESGNEAVLYAGQGNFEFTEVKVEITALKQGNAEWGDYDSDGDLDLLVTGKTSDEIGSASARIYSPDGDGVYQASDIIFPAVDNGEVKWADFNEDGFLDLLIAGQDRDTEAPSTRLFSYDQGSNSFLPSPDNSLTFQGVLDGQVAWGFANDDLKIDFIVQGKDITDASVFKLYLNEEETANFTPATPNDLTSNVGSTAISLGWNPPSGNAARVEGFSYNVYVGNTENTADISSPPANLNTNFHKIAQLGGQMGKYNLDRTNFTEGTYFWGVQAVDQDYEGGEFASGTFTILGPDFTDVTESSQLSATTLTKAALAWGDYENDGDLDVFMMGESGGNPAVAFYVNQGNGTFASKDIGISGLVDGDVAFWDLNGDRVLDIIISGESGGNAQTQIFKGNSDGTFSEVSSSLTAVKNSSLSIGDFDRDGDQDVLLAGITQDDTRLTAVYENQGNETFEALAGLSIPGVNAAVSWIDVDNDGLLDIFVSGEGTAGAVAELHLNQGDKTFEQDNSSTFTAVINSILDIGDIDNDGDTDLIVSGNTSGTYATIIYENDGGSLKEKQRLTGLRGGAVAFGDLNNDLFIDAIISGQTQSGDLVTQLFINSSGSFSQSLINSDFFEGLSSSAIALGDFDQDAAKDLDVLVAGSLVSGESVKLYQNDFDGSFTAPEAPSELDFSIQGSKANLKWDEPSSSQSGGFQYNVLIEIDGEANELVPSLSNKENGFRKIVQAGNAGQSTVTEINGLLPGQTYSFQVQSIDQAFRGSAFSAAKEFTVEGLPLEEEFETVFGLPKTGFSESTLSLVDVDVDGDLDVVGIGADENGAATSFILVNAINAGTGMTRQNLPLGLENGDIAPADVDNDGDVDLFLCGDDGTNPQAVLYINDGSGQFTASTNSFPGLLGGEAAWADLDNDGDVDLVYHGNDGTQASTLVYLNQLSDGSFNPLANAFPNVESGALSLEDIDNDGWVDVLLSGNSGTQLLSTVAINNGDLTFTQDTGELPGLRDAAIASGDIDNDGDMDFFISGNESLAGTTLLTELYLNNGSGDFQKSTVDFPDVASGKMLLLDIDLDGKRDLLIQGVGATNILELWNNETLGNNISFEKNETSSSLLPALGASSGLAMGDLDGNSTPDFLFSGISDEIGAGPEWYFFSNKGAEGKNTTPNAPEGLSSSVAGSDVQLSWKAEEDGSTYNLYIGTSSREGQIKAAASNLSKGTRLLVANGNVGHSSSTTILGLAPDTYYWGIQKIDQDGEGSEFSAESSFVVEPPFFEEVTSSAFGGTPEGVQNGALSWGDYQNDGDLDLVVTGSINGNPSTQLFVNDGNGVFQQIDPGLVNLESGDAVFFDGNSDGILDLVITGTTNANPITVYYEGTDNGTFNEKQSLTGLRNSSASVRDFDRDGDPDLILAGINAAGERLTSLFRNDAAVFVELTDVSLPGVNANISWWDYNNDGNPDIFITGSGSDGPLTALFENVGGTGTFTEVPDLEIPGVANSSVSIGDYDNDGDEDVLISGSVGAEYITRLYRNDDGNISASIGFEGLRNGSTAFGDYNHDGFLDVLLTGENEEGDAFGLLYINNNGTSFNLDLTNSPILTDVTLGQAAFADFDRDANGTLDIVMMGTDNTNSSLSLFKNNTVAPNNSPAAPTNLSSSLQGNSLVLSWDRPSGANVDGYSFNILLRNTDTGELIFSSQSATNGLRMVPEIGNAGHRTSMTVLGLNLGDYEWTVQSVDQG